ncbi:hypothetical protein HN51_068758 [Arachis hypogaea]
MSNIVRALYAFINGCTQESKDGSVKSRYRKSSEKLPPRSVETKEPDNHTTPQQEETRIGTSKKLPVVRDKSWKESSPNGRIQGRGGLGRGRTRGISFIAADYEDGGWNRNMENARGEGAE